MPVKKQALLVTYDDVRASLQANFQARSSTHSSSSQAHIVPKRAIASFRTRHRPISLALLAVLLIFGGCNKADKEAKFQKLMQSAKDYISQEKWEEARISLMSASDLHPKDPEVYFQLADTFVRLQRFPQAAENYHAALDYNPQHKEARMHLATLLLAAREYDMAEDHIKKLGQAYPYDLDVKLLEANLEAGSPRKNFTAAKRLYSEILAKDTNNVNALAGLGGVALSENNIALAEEQFLKALKIDPKNSSLQMIMADMYARQGRLDDAQEIVEGLVKDNPENSGLKLGLGEFLLRRGLADKANAQFEDALKADPLRHEARERLYDTYLVRKENDKAKALTAELVKASPENPGVLYFKGRDAEIDGKLSEALQFYTKALPGMGNFAPVFRHMGLLELASGDKTSALQHLNQAITIDPADVGARLALAKQELADHDLGQANEHVSQVLQRFPRQLGANVMRADIALLEGNLENARKVYQYLIESFPNNPTGYFKLGLLEEKAKNDDIAMQMYYKTISFDTGVLLPAQRLVGLLVKKKGLEKTISEMERLHTDSQNSKPEFKLVLGTLSMSNDKDPEHLDKARKYFNEALEGRPGLTGAYFALAAIDGKEGKTDAAAANYEKLIAQNPNHVPSYMLLALTRERQSKFQEAADVYKKLLDIAPKFGPAANNLAWLLADRLNGDLDEALRLAQIAKEKLPSDGGVADTLGWVNFKRGSKAVALSFLQEATDLERKQTDGKHVNPEILFHLAQVQASLGNKDKAKDSIREAIQFAGDDTPLVEQLKGFQKSL